MLLPRPRGEKPPSHRVILGYTCPVPLPVHLSLHVGADGFSDPPSGIFPLFPVAPMGGGGPSSGIAPSRGRRRAVLRGTDGLPDRQVWVEWFSGTDADREVRLSQARRWLGICHVNLLRLLQVGQAEPGAYAISEAPLGVELLTVVRAARGHGGLPPWWSVAVIAEAGRGLLSVHRHLALGDGGGLLASHGAIGPTALFVGWGGEVQLLAFAMDRGAHGASRSEDRGASGVADRALAPELRHGPRLAGAAADVYALGRLLSDLLPPTARSDEGLLPLLEGTLCPDPMRRLSLPVLLDGLLAWLLKQDAPLSRRQAIGALVGELCPRDAAFELLDPETPERFDFADPPEDVSQPEAPALAGPPPSLDRPGHPGPGRTSASQPRPRRTTPWVLAGLSGALALAGTWIAGGAIEGGPAAEQARTSMASVLMAPAPATPEWNGLRLSIEASHRSPESGNFWLRLRLVNPGHRPIAAPVADLRLLLPGRAPVPPGQTAARAVGPGKVLLTELDFPGPFSSGARPVLLLSPAAPGSPTARLPIPLMEP